MRIIKSHPLFKLVNSYVIDSPQPSNISSFWNFGSLLGLCLITGFLCLRVGTAEFPKPYCYCYTPLKSGLFYIRFKNNLLKKFGIRALALLIFMIPVGWLLRQNITYFADLDLNNLKNYFYLGITAGLISKAVLAFLNTTIEQYTVLINVFTCDRVKSMAFVLKKRVKLSKDKIKAFVLMIFGSNSNDIYVDGRPVDNTEDLSQVKKTVSFVIVNNTDKQPEGANVVGHSPAETSPAGASFSAAGSSSSVPRPFSSNIGQLQSELQSQAQAQAQAQEQSQKPDMQVNSEAKLQTIRHKLSKMEGELALTCAKLEEMKELVGKYNSKYWIKRLDLDGPDFEERKFNVERGYNSLDKRKKVSTDVIQNFVKEKNSILLSLGLPKERWQLDEALLRGNHYAATKLQLETSVLEVKEKLREEAQAEAERKAKAEAKARERAERKAKKELEVETSRKEKAEAEAEAEAKKKAKAEKKARAKAERRAKAKADAALAVDADE